MLKCNYIPGLPWWLSGKESPCNAGDVGLIPGSGRNPWRRKWQPIPVFLPGESHKQRSLAGYSSWGCKSWTWLSNSTTTANYVPSRLWTTEETKLDFPGGPVVKNLPANVGYMGLIPGPRKIPHAAEQLISLCAATTELMCHSWSPCTLESMFHNKRAAPACHN